MTPPGEDMNTDLRSRVVSNEREIAALSQKVEGLANWKHELQIKEATKDEQQKQMNVRFDELDTKIEKVVEILLRIMWLIIGGVIIALISFITSGGLKLL